MSTFPKSVTPDGEIKRRKPAEEAHTNRRLVTMRDQDIVLIDEAASVTGMPVSVFIRNAAIMAARKVVEENK
jgi:uncharacterized protein (DUF1778 family)